MTCIHNFHKLYIRNQFSKLFFIQTHICYKN
jgi:hypothetical protein